MFRKGSDCCSGRTGEETQLSTLLHYKTPSVTVFTPRAPARTHTKVTMKTHTKVTTHTHIKVSAQAYQGHNAHAHQGHNTHAHQGQRTRIPRSQRTRTPRSQCTKMGLTQVYGCVHTGVPVCILCTTVIVEGSQPEVAHSASKLCFARQRTGCESPLGHTACAAHTHAKVTVHHIGFHLCEAVWQ